MTLVAVPAIMVGRTTAVPGSSEGAERGSRGALAASALLTEKAELPPVATHPKPRLDTASSCQRGWKSEHLAFRFLVEAGQGVDGKLDLPLPLV